jgi:hypothetical protein
MNPQMHTEGYYEDANIFKSISTLHLFLCKITNVC